MQSSHSPLDLRRADIADVMTFLVLNKDAGEQSNHVRSMKKNVRFLKRHALVQRSSEMINPNPVLPTHMFFFTILLLLTSKQQALCA